MTLDRSQRGIARVLAKLDNSLENGNFYEAHQMYRTLFFRYTAQSKYKECLELLCSGALKLLEKQHQTSGADLGLLYLDTLEKRDDNSDTEEFKHNLECIQKILQRVSCSTVERETFITRALKWSGDVSGNVYGHPGLHRAIADVFWNEGNVEQARHHYLLCHNGVLCGRILVQIQTDRGFTTEVDLFIVQAVLQQLCVKSREAAQQTFESYTKSHPLIRHEGPYEYPLLNFMHFLFRTIDLKRLQTFRELCRLYKPSLDRDPSFEKYLTKIGVMYLGAPPPPVNGLGGGLFGDIFSRLFQDFDDDGDDDDDDPQEPHVVSSGNGGFNPNELD